ncbi:MAG: MarR family transcriptional regulator [Rhodoglobus sp.]|nr:MarR family transcriptional regulator [Rhodoglobus sp.]
MASAVSDLDAHLGYWLRFVSNHVSQAFARLLQDKGVTVAEWVAMRRLFGEGGMAPSLLADRIGMTRGAITKLVDRLIDKGLVVRRADRRDGRAQTLALTARGRALIPELAVLADVNDAEFFRPLTMHEQRTLRRLLGRLVEQNDLKTVPVD